MHILIITESFPPETKSASTLFFELAESLVQRGNKVSVVTRMPQYNLTSEPAKEMSGIEVYRVKMPKLARHIPFIRGFEHFLMAIIFFFGALRVKNVDVILVYSPPLPLGITGYWLGRLRKTPSIVNIQDPLPQGVIDLGLLKNKLLIKISRMMESFIYRRSDMITVHTEGNKEYVVSKGAKADRTEVVYNWVDPEMVKPGNRDNDFSRKYKLLDKFIISFAGTMGFAQDLGCVIDAAKLLKDNKDIQFVLVGDGVERKLLEERVHKERIGNIKFINTQPLDIYPQILNASDACLVTLRKELTVASIPGKVLSIMAAEKPIVASVPLSGDVPKKLEQYNCGVYVGAGEPDNLAKSILKLYNDRPLCEKMGRNGRKAAEAVFSRKDAVLKYEELFKCFMKKR
ncbi:MAG: glycosyltransferase family 4 protein [Candidatus Margulisiibacteriota bacterium]|nr:glycosyltransferase family 4 protein [Candidatus Margulisiibacteriota bacterium]